MFSFYEWQKKAILALKDKNGILAAPTGSGKTPVAYEWAGITRQGQPVQPEHRIIFTAPIKALSNERFLSLREMGIPVGIETGDFKKNTDAPVLCMTQEIYTKKYASLPNQRVIIDEMHYIFTNRDRTRAYIDGLRHTHPSSRLLLMSATFGKPDELLNYLQKLTGRRFELFETQERSTELLFLTSPVSFGEIEDALVFVFSARGVLGLAEQIANDRENREIRMSDEEWHQTLELAQIFQLDSIPAVIRNKVGIYYGNMLPKEKLFIETLFRKRLIDVVVGTDALSLGVNLPAKKVIFAQLAKYYDGPITKAEFLQMAGRAGRKGYFDTGYVGFIPSAFESFDYNTGNLYRKLLEQEIEPARIELTADIQAILKGKRSVKEEADFVAKASLPSRDVDEVLNEIQGILEEIDFLITQEISQTLQTIKENEQTIGKKFPFLLEMVEKDPQGVWDMLYEECRDILSDIYFSELSPGANVVIAGLFLREEQISALDIFRVVKFNSRRPDLWNLLQTRKFIRSLPSKYRKRITEKSKITDAIYRLDHTIYSLEEVMDRVRDQKAVSGKTPNQNISP